MIKTFIKCLDKRRKFGNIGGFETPILSKQSQNLVFQIHAVTDGKEALGNAIVRLRNGGKLYSGNGISTDIVAASIRAYINALNKIVFEEE